MHFVSELKSQAEVLAIIAKRKAAEEIASSGFSDEINHRINLGETHGEIAAVLADSLGMPAERIVGAIRQGVTDGLFNHNPDNVREEKRSRSFLRWQRENPDEFLETQRKASRRAVELAGPRKFTEDQADQIAQMIKQGVPTSEISQKLNIPESRIRAIRAPSTRPNWFKKLFGGDE